MAKIIKERERTASPEVIEGFKELLKVYSPSCVIADAQERAGVMSSYMKPIDRSTRFAGSALTVRLEPGDLVDCLDALSVAQAGDVIVVDAAGDTEVSMWGGLMSGLCQMKGVVGAIVDGGIRDIDETRDLGFGIFSKSIVPRGTHTMLTGRKDPIAINVPIQCAGVLVNPGDIVIGDETGVTVVPLELAEEILEKAQKQAALEEATRARIREGKTVDELLAEFGRL
jgi:4-hydroxy-4-methyl-2-oxoglutarate aldolase